MTRLSLAAFTTIIARRRKQSVMQVGISSNLLIRILFQSLLMGNGPKFHICISAVWLQKSDDGSIFWFASIIRRKKNLHIGWTPFNTSLEITRIAILTKWAKNLERHWRINTRRNKSSRFLFLKRLINLSQSLYPVWTRNYARPSIWWRYVTQIKLLHGKSAGRRGRYSRSCNWIILRYGNLNCLLRVIFHHYIQWRLPGSSQKMLSISNNRRPDELQKIKRSKTQRGSELATPAEPIQLVAMIIICDPHTKRGIFPGIGWLLIRSSRVRTSCRKPNRQASLKKIRSVRSTGTV